MGMGMGAGARTGTGAGVLVQIRDLAGRPRGVGFLADHHGTLLTSHEAVDGLAQVVLHAAGERTCVVGAEAVVPLPARGLALIRTEGLGVEPLALSVRDRIEAGTYVRIAAGCWREARVLSSTQVTYTATDRFHLLDDALELAIGTAGRDALRLGGGTAGGPVLDARTGAVLGVLGTALHTAQRDAGFAVPLRTPAPVPARAAADACSAAERALTDLLARNEATVPAYGADLNLAGVLELMATSVAQDGPPGALTGHSDGGGVGMGIGVGVGAPVERVVVARELTIFSDGPRSLLGLVGAPGSGRTTELAALAARRDRGERPAPTLWLRGADLRDADNSVADAAQRALERAARVVTASRGAGGGAGVEGHAGTGDAADLAGPAGPAGPVDLGDLTPERVARLAGRAGRPLLLLLDGPEEMPPALAHRLSEWSDGTAEWLRGSGAQLVVACREEYWERVGAEFPADLLHRPADDVAPLPPCVRLADLTPEEARRARSRYGIPDGMLTERDARHPLTLRLLSEVCAALLESPESPESTEFPECSESPESPAVRALDRHDVFTAHLDLMCLRVAVRLAAADGLRGTAVRRLAARVAGQVHEAARRSLGPGQGSLDRESFEAVFPWGPAPAAPGGGTGWASAVLAEGLLVPAGDGYRFAYEELADWLQGMHLDLDEALHALVHRPRTPQGAPPLPVPHHRAGPVVQALLLLGRESGTRQLSFRLRELTDVLDLDPASWWAARLLSRTLLEVPEATPYREVLRLLADRIVTWRRTGRPVPSDFAPAFWTTVPLPVAERLDLLQRLILADEAPMGPGEGSPADRAAEPLGPLGDGRRAVEPGSDGRRAAEPAGERYLDAVARLLVADPAAVQAQLARWFADERALPATPHATVATAAQALLHTHRRGALDDLTEVLLDSAHRRADELLAVLAEDEPSAVCRAVDRWAHDERPARRAAAVAFGLRAAPHARSTADRALLRYAAQAVLARPADRTLHGGALGLLVRDPDARDQYLDEALRRFSDGDPQIPPDALVTALTTHSAPVLDAFRTRLSVSLDPTETLRALADATAPALADATAPALADVIDPALARRATALVRETVAVRPETAGHVAVYVDRLLGRGPTARPVLLPLVTGLLDGGSGQVRAALATVLGASGSPASQPLRRELLELLLTEERDPAVLVALLHTAVEASHEESDGEESDGEGADGEGADGEGADGEESDGEGSDGHARRDDEMRGLVHRTGLLLVRTPEGATRFDRGLVDLARHVPGFAARVARWLTDTPDDWAVVVGPSTRRTIENLAGIRVPA
ncbi:trypsin-like peptidase domain-containing protein [Streptomyces sp. NPDC048297]|uniref:trypsin-like peptidase domain-containing protein n=1 Tax=Streptomyces sp. NPDC048297 TaxID=3365531 RepID=UPI003710652D